MAERADALTDLVSPLAVGGNPYAIEALCRLLVADDPEVEARAVVADFVAIYEAHNRVLLPMLDAYNAWVAGGIADAEAAGQG